MEVKLRKLDKILVANRGEIAICVMRAASELRIQTVGIYTYEDRYSLHRYKADEAYQIGLNDEPLKPYLDIEGLISLCKSKKIDAIHPGYGFLSENADFAQRVEESGFVFIGPRPETIRLMGDKVSAKDAISDLRSDLTYLRPCEDPYSRQGFFEANYFGPDTNQQQRFMFSADAE
jgi:pyruvate carboxylase